MKPGINNFSEIGKLNKVLLHRLGSEVEGLVPDNFERLLFDDIPYLKVAQHEHDRFADVLRENGVEVVYYVDETVKALSDRSVRNQFVKEFIGESNIYSEAVKEALEEYLMNMTVREMVEKCIAGVKKNEIDVKTNSLAEYIASGYPYYMDPMPNLYFTRDPGACVGNGLNIHHMNTTARRREPLLLKYMYMYNKDFAPEGTYQWYDYYDEESIEGGDVLVLSDEIVAIGLSQRTTVAGIEHFARNVLGSESGYKKILVFDIPKSRAFMHLDTVFTMVDYDKFTIHPEIEGPLQLFEITLDKDGEAHFASMTDSLENILKAELGLPAVDLIRCGGNDLQAAQREQWNDGSNTLCIAPGTVVTYERNYVTNDILDHKGIKVLAIPSSELSRGRGGPRCMSCPVNRVDL